MPTNLSPLNSMRVLKLKQVLQRSAERRMTRWCVTAGTVLLLLLLATLVTGCASPVQRQSRPLKPIPAPVLSQSPSTTPYSEQWQTLVDESRLKLTSGKVTP